MPPNAFFINEPTSLLADFLQDTSIFTVYINQKKSNSSTFQDIWPFSKNFSSRTFQDVPSFSSTFQTLANPSKRITDRNMVLSSDMSSRYARHRGEVLSDDTSSLYVKNLLLFFNVSHTNKVLLSQCTMNVVQSNFIASYRNLLIGDMVRINCHLRDKYVRYST